MFCKESYIHQEPSFRRISIYYIEQQWKPPDSIETEPNLVDRLLNSLGSGPECIELYLLDSETVHWKYISFITLYIYHWLDWGARSRMDRVYQRVSTTNG